MRKHLILVFLALAAVACGKKVDMDPGMYESNDVSLMVKGKMAFTYTEGTMQLAFSRTLYRPPRRTISGSASISTSTRGQTMP